MAMISPDLRPHVCAPLIFAVPRVFPAGCFTWNDDPFDPFIALVLHHCGLSAIHFPPKARMAVPSHDTIRRRTRG